ncbi:hypothetical protein LINGRAHAP2_LOCUS20129, partial [Linum grandiflorum]
SPKPLDSSPKPLDSSLIFLGLFHLIINFPRKSLKFNMHLPTSIQSEWICHDSSIDRDKLQLITFLCELMLFYYKFVFISMFFFICSSSIQAQKTLETQKIQEHEKTYTELLPTSNFGRESG